MDDRTRPDTNVVLLRRKGDPSEAEREQAHDTDDQAGPQRQPAAALQATSHD